MLISEFIDRTGVMPTAEEYARIEAEYYEFDGDKDAFCRAWVRCHPASVRKSKERKKRFKQLGRVLSVSYRLGRWIVANGRPFTTTARGILTHSEEMLLEAAGFNLKQYRNDKWYYVGDLKLDIERFVNDSSERV